MLLVILKTQVFSASTLSEAVAATIREIPGYRPRTLASGNEQHVPIRLHASDSPLPPLLERISASPIRSRVRVLYPQMHG